MDSELKKLYKCMLTSNQNLSSTILNSSCYYQFFITSDGVESNTFVTDINLRKKYNDKKTTYGFDILIQLVEC